MIKALNQYWDSVFQGIPQLSHTFRFQFPDRWVRFHSLPESKRYAESEAEYLTILSRHNAVLEGLIEHKKIVLVTTGFTGAKKPKGTPKREMPRLSQFDPTAKFWSTLAIHEIEDDPEFKNYWHIYASEWDWTPGVFDPILRLVADDVLSNVFILSMDDSWLYHPYDGGADIILSSADQRDNFQNRYHQWLSTHPEGL